MRKKNADEGRLVHDLREKYIGLHTQRLSSKYYLILITVEEKPMIE